jgi:hypothetical protein
VAPARLRGEEAMGLDCETESPMISKVDGEWKKVAGCPLISEYQ